MSSALAIVSVTAVLKNLLDNALIRQSATSNTGDVTVTALPPDRIALGAEERSRLNLYLYRLTPNSGRRRTSHFNAQEKQQTSPPLALDLHYLLTAYGERDFQAEIVMGYATQCLHETSILTRDIIRSALASLTKGDASSTGLSALAASTLAEQVEEITITPEFLSMEELSKLWSSLQAHSRLCMTYLVSVVLIEDQRVSGTAQQKVSQAGVS